MIGKEDGVDTDFLSRKNILFEIIYKDCVFGFSSVIQILPHAALYSEDFSTTNASEEKETSDFSGSATPILRPVKKIEKSSQIKLKLIFFA